MNKSATRFLSLDVFRGMTICFMIIVNTPGSGADAFGPLNHAAWHGFTPTDLVFPSFLFAVGNAMSFSMKRYLELGTSAVLTKIFKRTALIFLIGYLMYWFPFFSLDHGHITLSPISNTRIMGVLQRIALCYCFASLMIHFLSKQSVIILSVLFLIGYWVILLVFGDPANPLSMTGNAGIFLDKFVLGDSHMYHGEKIAFDPEGILSTIPAIVNVVIGYYAGKFIQQKGKGYDVIAKMLLTGCLLIFLALCWNMVFPINKKLWSSSFVLITTGLDLVILSFLVYALEINDWNKGNWTRFFTILGKNPLPIYVLSETLVILFWMVTVKPGLNLYDWINSSFYQVIAPGAIGSLLFAISYMLVCWSVGWLLDKKKVYIRV
ncbi:Predicted acyltransferase [Mucilaginibacter pineti]|uniref:Predicted acyltransferase n=1 Tax=Mucilaginibacter pineti TaxID=1391627 RepID=A0A1G7AIE4_9SPHI|nr:heparan-alpha-glucosaminide N-acetyltransferase domain-containing protein [Mucilaginibacter pineti]SDE14542.1 Predicted acyltransferase [Mucilaginibacter pineti]